MAKTKAKGKNLTKRQLARREKEAQQNQILIWISIIIGVIIVAITLYGVITETAKAKQPVARIGEETISATEFKTRQYYERWMARLQVYSYQELLNQAQSAELEQPNGDQTTDGTTTEGSENTYIQQLQITISNLESQLSEDLAGLFAGQVLDSMIEENLVLNEANQRSLSVSDEDIDLTIEEFMGFGASSVAVTDTLATPDPQLVEDTFEQFKTNVLEPSRFSVEDFRLMIKAGLLREELKQVLSADVALEGDQVQATFLILPTEEQANTIQLRINEDGEDAANILTELDEDDAENTYGYETPWIPIGFIGTQISPDIERVAFNTPVGKASEPILGPAEQYYVIYVNGHEELPLSEEVLYQTRQEKYDTWLNELKNSQVEYLDWQEAVLLRP
jgi:parvulin-like peptidyl-prolyl isomerase